MSADIAAIIYSVPQFRVGATMHFFFYQQCSFYQSIRIVCAMFLQGNKDFLASACAEHCLKANK
jgi:hypothetical protein